MRLDDIAFSSIKRRFSMPPMVDWLTPFFRLQTLEIKASMEFLWAFHKNCNSFIG